jgi:hypothetical protein
LVTKTGIARHGRTARNSFTRIAIDKV